MTDPYRPFPPNAAATPPQLDRTRLLRAGVPEETVAAIEQEFPSLPDEERKRIATFLVSRPDDAIREEFSSGIPEQPEAVTEESLMSETVDELEDRIRDWNAEHPDDHLTVTGRKVDLVGRLLDAYATEQAGAVQTADGVVHDGIVPASAAMPTPDGVTAATATVPTAPTATATDGSPAGTQTADAAGAGSTTTTGGTP